MHTYTHICHTKITNRLLSVRETYLKKKKKIDIICSSSLAKVVCMNPFQIHTTQAIYIEIILKLI